ncbi:DUF2207 domain-containing protein, partial [candidate division WOR-3 bacterium]|nr:DUF2207 domain-containing protein [candidate division WOR-3 bacterium]
MIILLLFSWHIKDFNSLMNLHKDGSLTITENITVDFRQERHHGIFRDIPIDLGGRFGNFELGFRINDIKMDGEKIRVRKLYRRVYGRKYLRLKIGNPNFYISGVHKYEIKYNVLLAARYFRNYDELYWNITGDEWEAAIDSVHGILTLYKELKLNPSDVKFYTGRRGEKGKNGSVSISKRGVEIISGNVYPGSGVTIDIKLPKGFLTKPSGAFLLFLRLKNNFPYFIAFLFFIFMFVRWWNSGKEFRVGPVATQYEPIKELTSAEQGIILDERADNKDLVSLLFDLATKGYLKIEEIETKVLFFLKNKDYKITITKMDTSNLKKHEADFLNGLMKFGNEFKLSELKGEFYPTVKKVKSSLYSILTKNGYFYGNPEGVRAGYISFGIFFFVGGGFLFMFSPKWAITLIIMGIILVIFSRGMPKRTPKGIRALRKILGFREFLMRVEQPKLKLMLEENPTLFFDFLPYALALGVVDKWAERFEGLTV